MYGFLSCFYFICHFLHSKVNNLILIKLNWNIIEIDFRKRSKVLKFDQELDNEKKLTSLKINKPKRDEPTYYYDIELHNNIKINEAGQDEHKYYEIVGDNLDENNLNEIESINTSRLDNSTYTHLYEKLKNDNYTESVYTKLVTKIRFWF